MFSIVEEKVTKKKAEKIKKLLEANHVRVIMREIEGLYSVLVEEKHLDQAHIIIEHQKAYDNFKQFE